jgi:hypothetical protein
MTRLGFKGIIVLLVVILLLASLVFGLLTYWLGAQILPATSGVPWGVVAGAVLAG